MGLSSSQARLLNLTSRMHQIEYKAAKLEAQKLQMANKCAHVYETYLDALESTKIQLKKINSDGSVGFEDATYNKLVAAGYSISFLDPTIGPSFSGIPAGYTPITTAAELQNMSSNGKYILMNDITLTGNWTPISTFSGTLNGNGHVIKNLRVNSNETAIGFISELTGGTIENLGFENSTVTGTGNNASDAAVIVGSMQSGKIENCWVNGATIKDSGWDAGVLVSASNGPSCTIKNCYVTGTITHSNIPGNFGDIIGISCSDENISNCYSTTSNDLIGDGDTTGCQRISAATLNELISNGTLPGGTSALDEHRDDAEWLTNMINAGMAIISKTNDKGEVYDTSVSTDTGLQEINDESKLRKAEAQYEADMRKIDAKDRKYDAELAALDTERNAVKAEMETLKTVARENVERTFKLFS